jgi:drug/metabolite transporter (DMT)-like permease
MKPTRWLALLTLCLLSAIRGLIPSYLPPALPFLLQQTFHFAALAAILGLVSARRIRSNPAPSRTFLACAAVFFAIPPIASAFAEGRAAAPTQILLFALLPSAVVLTVASQTAAFGATPDPRSKLVPSIAGAAGAFLLFPVTLPASNLSRLAVVLLVLSSVAAAIAAVRLHTKMHGLAILPSAAIAAGLCAVILGSACLLPPLRQPIPSLSLQDLLSETILCLVFEAPILFLTLWLLRELPPIAFAARYLFIPFLAVTTLTLLERPTLTLYSLAGMALLLLGAIWLPIPSQSDPT